MWALHFQQHDTEARQDEHVRQVENTRLQISQPEYNKVDHASVVVESVDKISARTGKQKTKSQETDAIHAIGEGEEETKTNEDNERGYKVDPPTKILWQAGSQAHERSWILRIFKVKDTKNVRRERGIGQLPSGIFLCQLIATNEKREYNDEKSVPEYVFQ